jgi:hypothetical protein
MSILSSGGFQEESAGTGFFSDLPFAIETGAET